MTKVLAHCTIFVECTCGEQDLFIATALRCICACVHVSVCLSGFDCTITSVFMGGFQKGKKKKGTNCCPY